MTAESANGVVISGYGVASGRSGDLRFPGGTIGMQEPIFRARGVSLATLLGAEPLLGTINVDVQPRKPDVIVPEIKLLDVNWSSMTPAENFWLFRATFAHAGLNYPAVIYMPDPSTKPEHFQSDGVIEIITRPIASLEPGAKVAILTCGSYIKFR